MNALIDRFPTSVEIDGSEYELNTDFRVGLEIMLAFEDAELTGMDKQLVMLKLLYKQIPPDLGKAAELAVLFLDCGEAVKSGGDSAPRGRLYSFGQDAKYIYSAIRLAYGIDLESTKYLHWWKFVYLFLDLPEDCFFQRLVALRCKKRDGKLSQAERLAYYKMQDILDLPDQKDAVWIAAEDEFMAQLEIR